VQWQAHVGLNGPSTEKVTARHSHDPLIVIAIPFFSNQTPDQATSAAMAIKEAQGFV
jgi:hypothetical protein